MTGEKALLYLLGEPGVGKSRIMESMTAHLRSVRQKEGLLAYTQYETIPLSVQLGVVREQFSGTDALPMNVQPDAVRWIEQQTKYAQVAAEGDRLANEKFLRSANWAGYELEIAVIRCDSLDLQQRRHQRALELGREMQSETWLKSRSTKLYNLLSQIPTRYVFYVDHLEGGTAAAISRIVEHSSVAQTLSQMTVRR